MKCRHCNAPLEHMFVDLGFAPPSNAYLSQDDLRKPEIYYPLRVRVCDRCFLVQTEDYTKAGDLFNSQYAYFSSTSAGWVAHAARFVQEIIKQLSIGPDSMVIEIACNDGYLLKEFIKANIPCLGIEPSKSTALAAQKIGIPVLTQFFCEKLGLELESRGRQADLIVGNNVFAHVPDINDFTRGMKIVLKKGGTITLEFPHLMRLLEFCQFDTIYHEHYSYLSLYAVNRIFSAAGLRVFDAKELPTHGGSLRVYGCHDDDIRPVSDRVNQLLHEEQIRGMHTLEPYRHFQERAGRIKDDLLKFLIAQKQDGKKVAAYGAAAKGNTLLNYAGIKPDLIEFVCDAAPSKQGQYLPGSHIPICHPNKLSKEKPDWILMLPWNIAEEIMVQQKQAADWGGRFVTAVPELTVFPLPEKKR